MTKNPGRVGAPVIWLIWRLGEVVQQLDMHWREHLAAMDYLPGIYLRAYAQKNPKQEYKREAFACSRRCWTASAPTL